MFAMFFRSQYYTNNPAMLTKVIRRLIGIDVSKTHFVLFQMINLFAKELFLGLFVFCFQKQRDPRLNEILFPEYDKKSVTKIIQTYETDPEYKTKSTVLF